MKTIKIILKSLLTFLSVIAALLVALSVTPIYRFQSPAPFSGKDIYDPYADFDSAVGWKRSVLHTHTKVDKGINECPEYPDVVWNEYRSYGYDIIGFANHQALTPHPVSDSLYIGAYEHGYNFFKFHIIPFGAGKVLEFDHPLPFTDSHKQWMTDLLARNADIVQFNHPMRTGTVNAGTMQKLTGYRLMEADAGVQEWDNGSGTDLALWDEALSAGQYCHNIINDDNHNPFALDRIARRCSWLNTHSVRYEDVLEALTEGNFYSARIPDYGGGDKAVKLAKNQALPRVEDIGLRGDTVYMTLSAPSERIYVISQGGEIVDSVLDATSLEYVMLPGQPYVRLTAYYEDGFTIYTNAWARYDASQSDSPYVVKAHPVRWGATVAFNLVLLLMLFAVGRFICRLWKPCPCKSAE